ncbi:hypothetical protein OTU49_002134, partial [Cherax quadricarinatus]
RNWVSECGAVGGVRWGDKCYFVHTSDLASHSEARVRCSSRGARLLSITSQVENDFVSDLLEAMGGDTLSFYTEGVMNHVNHLSQRRVNSLSLPFSAWWPGWNGTQSGRRSTARNTEGTSCISLKKKFPVPQRGGEEPVTASADYFFWQSSNCEEKLHYVCETNKIDVGCINGRGMTY